MAIGDKPYLAYGLGRCAAVDAGHAVHPAWNVTYRRLINPRHRHAAFSDDWVAAIHDTALRLLEETSPLMHVADATVARLFPHDPPRFFARPPCGYHDRARIERELRDAGFTSVAIEEVRPDTDVSSAWDAAIGCWKGTPLGGEIEDRDPNGRVRATDAVAAAMRESFAGGPFRAPLQALLVAAT